MTILEKATFEKLNQLSEICLYHGTGIENVVGILKRGLLPWNLVGWHNWSNGFDMFDFYTPKPNCIYLADFERALEYANYPVEDGKSKEGVVVEVNVKTERLLPDEDSNKGNWIDSFLSCKCCAHEGIILPSSIIGIYNAEGRLLIKQCSSIH